MRGIEMEEWRPVVGFEGYYEVSSLGAVRSLDRSTQDARGSGRRHVGKILKPSIHRDGYCYVKLHARGIAKTVRIHGIVAAAFIGPRPAGKQVNHISGDKLDNSIQNLEYVTPSENMRHAFRTGVRIARSGHKQAEGWRAGESNGRAKMAAEDVLEIRRRVACGESKASLAREFGVSGTCIGRMVTGKSWACIAQ
jgi:hypothetical protein